VDSSEEDLEEVFAHPLKDIREVVSVKVATLIRVKVLQDISLDQFDTVDPGPYNVIVLLDEIVGETVIATLMASEDVLGIVVVPDGDVADTIADLSEQEGSNVEADMLKELGVTTKMTQRHLTKEGAGAGSPDPLIPDRVEKLDLLSLILAGKECLNSGLVMAQRDDVLAVNVKELFKATDVDDFVADQIQVLVPVSAVSILGNSSTDLVLVKSNTSLSANVLAGKLEPKELSELFILQCLVCGNLQSA
jgi:hypothetical protein